MRNRVKQAMNAHLSALHATNASRAAIMQKVRGEFKMKRKLSLGLILALALTIIVIGALAAVLLTHKEFVDQVMAPKASENNSDVWTREEMDAILRIAKEYGVELTEDTLLRISRADLNYKEETMRLFAKQELGFYPSTWSIEDQAWYNQVLVDSGLIAQRMCFVPEGNEISQQQALDIAQNYIKESYDANAAVTDTSKYRRHMTYQAFSDNLYNKGKQWYIGYEPLDSSLSQYTFLILPDGTVKEAKRELGLTEAGRAPLTANENLDLYRDTFGDHRDWSPETWIFFRDALSESVTTYGQGEAGSSARIILSQGFALPNTVPVTKDAAIAAAKAAIVSTGSPGDKELSEEHQSYALLITDNKSPVWKVSFFCSGRTCGVRAHTAEVDANTCKVLLTGTVAYTQPWYAPYVLTRHLPEPVAEESKPTPRPDGMPRIWRSDIAPKEYWDELEAIGYNADTAGELYGDWQMKYGDDPMFWPLPLQAIDGIWHYTTDATTAIPGLPGPEDIPQEKALEIAMKIFREGKGKAYDEKYITSLKASVSFTFNTPQMGDRVWFIRFVEVTLTDINIVGGVTLDAATGEVLGDSQDGEIFLTAGVDPSSPAYTPRPDGKPGVWYSDIAPAYYWEALDAAGYNRDTAADFQRRWAKEYGGEKLFWPLKAKALEELWHYYDGSHPVLPGLPDDKDIKQEDALNLARAAMIEGLSYKYDPAYLNSLTPAFSFQFNANGMGSHMWFIQFFEITPDGFKPMGFVNIDAKTGEILSKPDGVSNG